MNTNITYRSYFPGMGEAVADRTVNRRIFTEDQKEGMANPLRINPSDPFYKEWKNAADLSEHPSKDDNSAPFMFQMPKTRMENWGEVSKRVAEGNALLAGDGADKDVLQGLIAKAAVLMSGRHLQHTDKGLKNRPMEVVTNCSTAPATFILFYLLLNGSGVGRAYDDDMMKVDWGRMPEVKVVIDKDYPDRGKHVSEESRIPAHTQSLQELCNYRFGSVEQARANKKVTIFNVPDSRGGWAKALEIMENMAYEGRSDELLILDFTAVRCWGSPIRGMQNRPSSGPGPLMAAIVEMAKVKRMGLDRWEATMHMDHHAAQCVLVGGARRAARMATKTWRDRNIFRFIRFKSGTGFWTSNNSVTIDEEFRQRCNKVGKLINEKNPVQMLTKASLLFKAHVIDETDLHAWSVLVEIANASYNDGTGEPGIINQDKLVAKDAGIEAYCDGMFAGSKDFQLDRRSVDLMKEVAVEVAWRCRYSMITNPCGEIALLMLGAYCVLADVVPFYADSHEEAELAFRMATRALIRTNTMDCLYSREVKRTNRIGVGITGFHEWAYDKFGYSWYDIIDEEKSKDMWLQLSSFKRAVVDEAEKYSKELGVAVPHTDSTFKPAGTTSKLFGVTEGAHLPSMRWYLRWVQMRLDDPLVKEYEDKGYPVRRDLKDYKGMAIVGFPTRPTICELGDGEWVVTAAEATPEEQYQFLRMIEKYWIVGVEEDGVTPLSDTGNQVSYTLKYDPEVVDFKGFFDAMLEGQFSIRCCSVMPQTDGTAYEYQPEEPISRERYDELTARIDNVSQKEEVGFEHVVCAGGACPVDFAEN